jgi:hypothetical protein
VEKLEPATVNLQVATFKAAVLPARPLVAVKAVSVFYSSDAVGF